jgi:hypothetical protein
MDADLTQPPFVEVCKGNKPVLFAALLLKAEESLTGKPQGGSRFFGEWLAAFFLHHVCIFKGGRDDEQKFAMSKKQRW